MHEQVNYYYQSVIVISFSLSQSDPIKRLSLHLKFVTNVRDRDGDDDVVELELILLKFVLDVHVATTLPVVRGPAVD
jgi:hypothetical protein